MRWETDTRYMTAAIQQDLLLDWIVIVENGGLHNRLGRLRVYAQPTRDDANLFVAALNKRRKSRGYKLIPPRQ